MCTIVLSLKRLKVVLVPNWHFSYLIQKSEKVATGAALSN